MRFFVLTLLFALVAAVCASPVLGDSDGAGKGKGRGKGKGGRGKGKGGRGKGKGGRGNGKRVSMGTLCEMSDDEIAKGEPLCACIPPPFNSSLALISSVVARMHTFMGT
jgi:hypothetical protein